MVTDEIMEAVQLMVDGCDDLRQQKGMLAMQEMLGEWNEWEWLMMSNEDKQQFISRFLEDTIPDGYVFPEELTVDQQTKILHDAARASNMEGHVQQMGDTAAEQVMRIFGALKNTPRKTSYLYCDSVDCCFYFQGHKAVCTFTAKWYSEAKDLDRLQDAAILIKVMLRNMQQMANKLIEVKR